MTFAGPATLTLKLEYDGTQGPFLFKNQKAEYDAHNNLLLAPLLDKIAAQGFESKGHVISYFATVFNAFVIVGKDPISATAAVGLDEIDLSKPLVIKFKPVPGAAQ